MPANEAVCLNPEIDYALVDAGEQYYIIAQDLLNPVLERLKLTTGKPLLTIKGQILEHQRLNHPFYDKTVPIVLGEHVTTDTGTGCVHTAPAHGPEDYTVGMRYQLEFINPVLANGCYAPECLYLPVCRF